jgi:hypothetical protein
MRSRSRAVIVISRWSTIWCRGRVLFVAENRTTESLDQFWKSLTDEQIDAVEAVAMDMWDPYVTSTLNHLPEAESRIVFDKFHIAENIFPKQWIWFGGAKTDSCGHAVTIGSPGLVMTGFATPRPWNRQTVKSSTSYVKAT